jgi:uncharacterized delta-60 repeat protein
LYGEVVSGKSVTAAGITGATGQKGDSGPKGDSGGPKGDIGDTGGTGPTGPSGVLPGGINGSIQYNNNNQGITGSPNLIYSDTTTTLTLAGTLNPNTISYGYNNIEINKNSDNYVINTNYNTGGAGFNGSVYCMAIDSSKNLIFGGSFSSFNGNLSGGVARLKSTGVFDPTFVSLGFNDIITTIAVDSSNNIYCGGSFTTYGSNNVGCIVRLKPTGAFDSTFNTGVGFSGRLTNIARDLSGNIMAVGFFTTYNTSNNCNYIARIKPTGAFDSTLSLGSSVNVAGPNCITVDSSGNILIGGGFTQYNGNTAGRIARLKPNGAFDSTFLGGFTQQVNTIIFDSNNRILVGGLLTTVGSAGLNTRVTRLLPTGGGDSSWVGGVFDNRVFTLAIDLCGNILAGGLFKLCSGITSVGLARLTSTGIYDPKFSSGSGFNSTFPGIVPSVYSLMVDSENTIYIGGDGIVSFNSISFSQNSLQLYTNPYTIEIGNPNGTTQNSNTITLNATSNVLNTYNAGAFYVKPIRQPESVTNYSTLFYDPSGGEIVAGRGTQWVGGNTGPYAAPTTGTTAIATSATKLYEKAFTVSNANSQFLIHYNVVLGSGGSNYPVTSTLGISTTANNTAGNCVNLYNNATGITLTGANTDAYIAAVTSSTVANLSGFATVSNLEVGTQYVSLWAASGTATQTFAIQKINLVIY